MIRFVLQIFSMMMAYVVAFSAGYLGGKGVELPWMVKNGLCVAFAFIILAYGALEKK